MKCRLTSEYLPEPGFIDIDLEEPISPDLLAKRMWDEWEKRCPDMAALVQKALDDKIASVTFTKETRSHEA